MGDDAKSVGRNWLCRLMLQTADSDQVSIREGRGVVCWDPFVLPSDLAAHAEIQVTRNGARIMSSPPLASSVLSDNFSAGMVAGHEEPEPFSMLAIIECIVPHAFAWR